MKSTLVLADDHGILRAGLRALLNADPDLDVVAEASDGAEALAAVQKHQPDLAILDISMPGLNGLEVLEALNNQNSKTKILILTVHEDTFLLKKALKLGASGYIVKQAVESELINAIRAILRGEIYIHPSLTRELVKAITPAKTDPSAKTADLTPRETEVLYLIVQGYSNREISEELNISIRTVETHRANIMQKLNLRTRVELVRYAKLHHMID
jgi:DNA-binding NarL/FixJ family response regulator